jgi:TatD DNase family protein
MLVDTHCHLDDQHFPEGVAAVLERAHGAGVGAFVVVGVSGVEAGQAALSLAESRRDVVVALGVQPHDAAAHGDETEALAQLARHECCVAVGEIGLDFYHDLSPRPVQVDVFRRSVAVARAVRKPVVIHTRDAPDQTLEILAAEGARDVGGVIHCFSADRAFAARALDLGFDISFSGIVTFRNARAVQEVAAWAPLDRILVETDAPYLAPVPLRGRRCEPAHVVHTAQCVADLRGIQFVDLAAATTENACRRFGAPLIRALSKDSNTGPS